MVHILTEGLQTERQRREAVTLIIISSSGPSSEHQSYTWTSIRFPLKTHVLDMSLSLSSGYLQLQNSSTLRNKRLMHPDERQTVRNQIFFLQI
ncbi:hypothetical protein INR49_021833 [Caranx melampygus]|nr:hypothetical protein INR49_021833 [Caranx melampygus]